MNKQNELPDGWIETTLGEIGQIVSGGTPSTTIPEYWDNEINWITPLDLSGDNKKYISKGRKSISKLGLQNSSAKLLPTGTVLFSSRAPIGYVAIANSELCTNQGFKSIIPFECVYNEYLYYYLKSAKRKTEDLASGTTFKEISLSNFSKLPIPLPPLPEQHRIVAKIEELFSRLDKGIESLKTARQQLKTYRQAVLKYAFEGKLTETWRQQQEMGACLPAGRFEGRLTKSLNRDLSDYDDEHNTKTKAKTNHGNHTNHKNQGADNLPEGWVWKKLGELAQINPKLPFHEIDDDLEVSFLPMKYVEEETNKIHLVEFKKYAVVKKGFTPMTNGDVIFAKITPCMENGKIAVVHSLKNNIGFGSTEFHVLRCKKDFLNSYLFYYLIQERVRQEAEKNMTGAVGQRRVPKKFLEDLHIPYPPHPEQHLIVSEIEKRLSVADKLEEAIATALQQAEALRQSILKKAFEGKLLSEAELQECRQDPEWEPASVLLERIKAEKSGLEKKGLKDGRIAKKKSKE